MLGLRLLTAPFPTGILASALFLLFHAITAIAMSSRNSNARTMDPAFDQLTIDELKSDQEASSSLGGTSVFGATEGLLKDLPIMRKKLAAPQPRGTRASLDASVDSLLTFNTPAEDDTGRRIYRIQKGGGGIQVLVQEDTSDCQKNFHDSSSSLGAVSINSTASAEIPAPQFRVVATFQPNLDCEKELMTILDAKGEKIAVLQQKQHRRRSLEDRHTSIASPGHPLTPMAGLPQGHSNVALRLYGHKSLYPGQEAKRKRFFNSPPPLYTWGDNFVERRRATVKDLMSRKKNRKHHSLFTYDYSMTVPYEKGGDTTYTFHLQPTNKKKYRHHSVSSDSSVRSHRTSGSRSTRSRTRSLALESINGEGSESESVASSILSFPALPFAENKGWRKNKHSTRRSRGNSDAVSTISEDSSMGQITAFDEEVSLTEPNVITTARRKITCHGKTCAVLRDHHYLTPEDAAAPQPRKRFTLAMARISGFSGISGTSGSSGSERPQPSQKAPKQKTDFQTLLVEPGTDPLLMVSLLVSSKVLEHIRRKNEKEKGRD